MQGRYAWLEEGVIDASLKAHGSRRHPGPSTMRNASQHRLIRSRRNALELVCGGLVLDRRRGNRDVHPSVDFHGESAIAAGRREDGADHGGSARHSADGNVDLEGVPSIVERPHRLSMVYGGGGVFGIGYGAGVAQGLARSGIPVASAPSLGTSAGAWVASAVMLGLTTTTSPA